MIILNVLERIFNILFTISIIISAIVGMKKMFASSSQESTESNVSDNENNKSSWKDNLKLAIILSAIVVLIVGVVFIVINIKNLYWLIIFISVPTYLEQITGTYQSFGIVEKVVKSSNNGKLSFKEQVAIKTLAYALWFLGIYKIFEKVIANSYACTNVYLSDMSVALIYVLAFYLYIFFICSLLPELIFSAIRLLKKIFAILPWKSKIKSCGDFWVNKIEKPIAFKSTLISQWETIGKWKLFIRWIRYLLLPITFVLDIIIMLINVMISFISSSVGYFFVLARMVKKTVNRISNWTLGLSDKRVVVISFRIALIMALICIVILNRYQSIFKMEDASTAVFEFVASAIIIPVVFEWINSVKNNQSCSGK